MSYSEDEIRRLTENYRKGLSQYEESVQRQLETANQLRSGGNQLMKLGCQMTLLTWFGIPLLIFFIAFLISLFSGDYS